MSIAHNRVLGKNTYAWLSLALVVCFTLLGIYYGTPEPTTDQTFPGVIRRFGSDDKTRTILAFIIVDIATGIMAAIRLRIFDIQRLANFYASSVIPYLFGYLLIWILTLLGLDAVLPQSIQTALASLGFAAIVATLSGSILDNVHRMTTPLSYTESSSGPTAPPTDPKG